MSLIIENKINHIKYPNIDLNEDSDVNVDEDKELNTDEFIIEIDPKEKILSFAEKKEKDVQNMIGKLSNKIFDVITINGIEYFLDNDFKLLWDSSTDIVGFFKNNKYIFWNDVDMIIKQIKLDDIEVQKIMKKFALNYI